MQCNANVEFKVLDIGTQWILDLCNDIVKEGCIPHTHPFHAPFSGTTQVSRYQKGKTIWILLKQKAVSGSDISWAVCKYIPRSRQITTPAPHHRPTNSVKALKALMHSRGLDIKCSTANLQRQRWLYGV